MFVSAVISTTRVWSYGVIIPTSHRFRYRIQPTLWSQVKPFLTAVVPSTSTILVSTLSIQVKYLLDLIKQCNLQNQSKLIFYQEVFIINWRKYNYVFCCFVRVYLFFHWYLRSFLNSDWIDFLVSSQFIQYLFDFLLLTIWTAKCRIDHSKQVFIASQLTTEIELRKTSKQIAFHSIASRSSLDLSVPN